MQNRLNCSIDRAYQVDAKTIEEKSNIWKACAPLKAKNRTIGFLIFSSLVLIFYTVRAKDIVSTVFGIGITLLVGALVYYINIQILKREAENLLMEYNSALKLNPSISVNEFTEDMKRKDLRQRDRHKIFDDYARGRHYDKRGIRLGRNFSINL